MVGVSPAAANGKRERPTSGGESAGKILFTPTHAPVISDYCFFFVNFCLFEGMSGAEKKEAENHITGLKRVCKPAQPSAYRAVPHVHTAPPGHTAVPSGLGSHFYALVPLVKQDCLA